jgi:hypothetical protein
MWADQVPECKNEGKFKLYFCPVASGDLTTNTKKKLIHKSFKIYPFV